MAFSEPRTFGVEETEIDDSMRNVVPVIQTKEACSLSSVSGCLEKGVKKLTVTSMIKLHHRIFGDGWY
jgi:hypothetical protein